MSHIINLDSGWKWKTRRMLRRCNLGENRLMPHIKHSTLQIEEGNTSHSVTIIRIQQRFITDFLFLWFSWSFSYLLYYLWIISLDSLVITMVGCTVIAVRLGVRAYVYSSKLHHLASLGFQICLAVVWAAIEDRKIWKGSTVDLIVGCVGP